MKALTSLQGTAMAETALCSLCARQERLVQEAVMAAEASDDWDGIPVLKDCDDNDALECLACGRW